jgi:hypothetical protein
MKNKKKFFWGWCVVSIGKVAFPMPRHAARRPQALACLLSRRPNAAAAGKSDENVPSRLFLFEEKEKLCLLLSSLKSGLTRGIPFTTTAMPASQPTTCKGLKRKLKREKGEEGASCRTIGIETQTQG